MADHKRGRALKQLQLLPRENKEGAEKRPIQKEPGRRKREGSTATAGRENRIMKGAGLGDLRSEDRQRLRQLIQDLALAESEKEEAVGRLKRERKDHDQQVSVLRARQAALVKDKGKLEHKVKSLQTGQEKHIAQAQPSRQQPETELLHSRYKQQQILLEHQQHLHDMQKRQIDQQLQQIKHHQVSEKSNKLLEDRLKNDGIHKQEGSGLFYGGGYPSWSRSNPLSTHQPAVSSHLGEQSLGALSDSMCSLPQISTDSQVLTNPQTAFHPQTSSNLSSVTLPSSNTHGPTTQNYPMLPRPANPTPPFLLHQTGPFLSTLESVSRDLYSRPVTRKTAKVAASESCTSTSISSSYFSSPPKLTHEVSVQVTALESVSTQTDAASFEPALSESRQSPSLSIPSSPVVTHEVSVQATGLENVSTQTDSHTSHPHTSHSHPHTSHSHPHTTHSHPHTSHSHPHTSHSHPHTSHSHPHTTHSHPHTAHTLSRSSHNLTELQTTKNDLETTLPTSLKEPSKHSSPVMKSPIHNPLSSSSKNSSASSSDGDRSSVTLGDSVWRHSPTRAVVSEEDVSVLLNQGCHGVDALAVVREARLQDSLPSETDDEELLEELFFISTNER